MARAYAKAYAAFNDTALRNMLAPDLTIRQVNPSGYLQLATASDSIEATPSSCRPSSRTSLTGTELNKSATAPATPPTCD